MTDCNKWTTYISDKLFDSVVSTVGNEPIEVVKFYDNGGYYHIHPEIHKKDLWQKILKIIYFT